MIELAGRVQDKVVIVTGGAGGIGSAACRAIAAEGGKVLVADYDAAKAGAVADGITKDGGTAESVGVDVTDRAQVQSMIGTAVDAFGELNVIFNNAGMTSVSSSTSSRTSTAPAPSTAATPAAMRQSSPMTKSYQNLKKPLT